MLRNYFILIISYLVFKSDRILAKQQLSVGAIFSNDQDEHEIAFRSAIERVNIYERSFELVPVIQYANPDDSFVLEKTACNLISQGVVAIFGPSSESGIISSICNSLEIPHIIYDWQWEDSATEREFSTMTINLYPETLILSKAYADIIKDFTWRSYTVLYEGKKELIQIQDVFQLHGPKDNPVTVRKLPDNSDDYRPLLKKIKNSGEQCIILHCSVEKIVPILRQANELKILGEYQSFFLAPLDVHTIELEELIHSEANITSIRIFDPANFDVKNAAYDWEQSEKRLGKTTRILPHKTKTTMFTLHDAVWVFAKSLAELEIIDELVPPKLECKRNNQWSFGRRITEFIKAKSHESSTGRIDFNENGQRIFFQLRIMELSPGGFQDIATWDPVQGLAEIVGESDFASKRIEEKLQNKTFIVTSRIGAPFLMHREAKEGETLEGNARYEGYSMDLIDSIAKQLGFKYRFELTPDGRYGSYNKVTKKWDGLIKQLLEGKADLGICDLTMTSARRKAVDFTPPFMTLGISILYSKPENAPPDLFSFLSPFSLDVWIYMGTAYLCVSLLMYALARMAPDDWENPHPCESEPEELENAWTLRNTTWLVMGSLMGQGCDILPKATSTRLATGMWWFFALMMLNSYTANLAAFLTMSRMDSPIEGAEDLAKQTKIKYGTVSGGSTQAFFRDSNFSIYQRMWAAMESARPSVFMKSNDEAVERVLKSKGMYAFLMESTTLEYIIERNCELQQVGGWLDSKTYGIAMPFNSPYRKPISKAILKLGESGGLAELKRKWWKEKHGGGACSQATEETADTPELGLENVGGVFLVLGFGLFFAVIIGLTEFIWNVRQVAIDEKISVIEAFKQEGSFIFKFWITTKPVRGTSKDSQSSSGSGTSKKSSKSSKSAKSTGKSGGSETKSTNTHNGINISMQTLKSNKSSEKDSKSKIKNRNNLDV